MAIPTRDQVMAALSTVKEPELGRDLVTLNMIKDLMIDGSHVSFTIELTTPACPIGPMVTEQISESIGLIPGVKNVDVEFTFDPPWNPDKMSDEARADLGLD